jgi:predicted 2-oxoglutarate/Fe(II)-dependent dioxygenase YbiX
MDDFRKRSSSLGLPQRVILQHNVVRKDECRRLIAIYDAYARLSTQTDYCGNKVLHYLDLETLPRQQARLESVVHNVIRALRQHGPFEKLHLEALFVAMLPRGAFHPSHADNERLEQNAWVPNHTAQRDYSAILYLNTEFRGGVLHFDALGIRISPTVGLLVAFPSHHEFVHAVTRVVRGRRYSVALWFTRSKSKSLEFRSREN